MKNLAVTTLLVITCFACDNTSSDVRSQSNAKIIEVENRAINGQQWRITSFSTPNDNLTNQFAGFIFEFDASNLLTVTNGVENFSGSWTVGANGSDNSSNEFEDIDFVVDFSHPKSFETLSDHWKIISFSDSRVELKATEANTSTANARVVFEKI